MTVEVLKKKSEIDQARRELRRRGLSCINSWWLHFLSKKGLTKSVHVGEYIKSWDVLETATFIESNISKDAPILDIGAYASEILCILHRLGYSNLTGIDLNSEIKLMPYANKIRYEACDFMHTPFKTESFQVITATSVIEHGFNSSPLLSEISRLLQSGGYFIASFDYWPEKVDTSGTRFFGMDWRVFSKQEVLEFIKEAQDYNLTPNGTINLQAEERAINCAGKDYTFGWLALKKK